MRSRRRITFLIWIITVAGVLICRPAISRFCLLVIFALLCTTPANAIRLPRAISELSILLGTLFLRWPHDRANITYLCILMLMLALLRLWNKSPWWAVLYGWLQV